MESIETVPAVNHKLKRQGDVLVFESKIPEDAAPVPGFILVQGQHTHQVTIGCEHTQRFETPDGRQFLRIAEGKEAVVTHEEHGPIPLAAGEWEVRRQLEYAPDELRYVAD